MLRNLARYILVKSLYFFVKGNGVLLTKRNKKQWVYDKNKDLGGMARPVYFPNGIEDKYLGTMESQAITAEDFWTCVSNSLCRCVQIILQYLITIDPVLKKGLEDLGFIDDKGNVNISQRALAVMSGTVPGRGNSLYRVAETARLKGLVSEKFCPTLPGMTEWQFFNLPPGTEERAKKFLELVGINHEDLPGEPTKEVFTHGPIQGAVSSPYDYNGNVVVPPSYYNYNHAVCQYGTGEFKKICDSYPEFLKNFSLNYKLSTQKVIYLTVKKKIPTFRLAKTSSPAVFLLCEASLERLGVADSPIEGLTGGELLKKFSGTYGNAGIETITDEEMNRYRHSGNIQANLF